MKKYRILAGIWLAFSAACDGSAGKSRRAGSRRALRPVCGPYGWQSGACFI